LSFLGTFSFFSLEEFTKFEELFPVLRTYLSS